MTSVVDVANMTLGRLYINTAIASLSDGTNPARVLSRFYDHCRQKVLRTFPWGFAQKAEELVEVSDQTFPGWTYVYQYPDECLNVRAVADEGGIRMTRSYYCGERESMYWPLVRGARRPFQVALKSDGASKVLLSDVPDAWVFYTVDVTNPGVWTQDFADALAWCWATECGGPLQAKRDILQEVRQQYALWASWAAANDMNEQKDDAQAESASIACRG